MAWGMRNCVIQLFGSSIMEGRIGVETAAARWYELFRALLCERFPATCFSIHNGAVGGESIRELMGHFEADLAGHTPDWCLAMFGWNNFDLESPGRVVPFAEQELLIGQFFRSLPATTKVIGVIAQPMLDKYHYCGRHPAYEGMRKEYGSVNAFHDLERKLHRRLFSEHGCPFLDLSLLFADDPERYLLSIDGIHLSPAGHRLFADAMAELLVPMLAEAGAL